MAVQFELEESVLHALSKVYFHLKVIGSLEANSNSVPARDFICDPVEVYGDILK